VSASNSSCTDECRILDKCLSYKSCSTIDSSCFDYIEAPPFQVATSAKCFHYSNEFQGIGGWAEETENPVRNGRLSELDLDLEDVHQKAIARPFEEYINRKRIYVNASDARILVLLS